MSEDREDSWEVRTMKEEIEMGAKCLRNIEKCFRRIGRSARDIGMQRRRSLYISTSVKLKARRERSAESLRTEIALLSLLFSFLFPSLLPLFDSSRPHPYSIASR